MTPATVLERTNRVNFLRLDEEMLAIDADAGFCYSLNDTAGSIWNCLEQPMAVEAICTRLAGEYAIDMVRCRTEVLAIAQDLANAGLLQEQSKKSVA